MKLKLYLLVPMAVVCHLLSFAQSDIQIKIVDDPSKMPKGSQEKQLNIYANCPDDITVYADPGKQGADVYWNPITVSTSCSYCTNPIPNCVYMGDFNGHQYYCSLFLSDRDGAEAYALNHGGYLSSINSNAENSFLASQLIDTRAYIGLSDEHQEGEHLWDNNDPVSFTNWDSFEPDDTDRSQNAVELKSSGKWNDCSKYPPKEFIIEFPCLDGTLESGLSNGSFFPLGTTEVRYRFRDACGYETICSFHVTVLSHKSIYIHCSDDIVTQCQKGLNGAYVHWPYPTATTDCDCNFHMPDCIDMGWQGHKQFFCSLFSTSWNDAENWARAQNSNLVIIENEAENMHLASQIQRINAYIGLHDENGNGNFTWVDGRTPNYTNWEPGEPSNIGQNRYVELQPDGQWKTTPGNNGKEFICEKKCLQIHQTSGPRNGGFFPVGMTTVSYRATDACGNSKSCSFKVTVQGGTSIECPDDIYVDCNPSWQGNYVHWEEPEVHSCCNDCIAGHPINGFIYMGARNGQAYYCSTFEENWLNAEQFCQSRGGHLVSIASDTENDFLANMLQTQQALIGLSDQNSEGFFEWSDGSNYNYNHFPSWGSGNTNQRDFVVLTPNGHWDMVDRYTKKEFIMKIPCTHVSQIEGPSNGSFFDEGRHRITYKVEDGCGSSSTCSFYVHVSDCCDKDFTLHCPPDYRGCPGDATDPSNTGEAAIDQIQQCSGVDINYYDEVDEFSPCDIMIERTWVARIPGEPDSEQECVQWIDLLDDEKPYFTDVPADLTLCPGENIPQGLAWAEDNCGDATIQFRDSLGAGNCNTGQINYRIYTATDPCGNEKEYIQRVFFRPDSLAPVISGCPGDIDVQVQDGDCEKKVYWQEPMATDDCGAAILSSNFQPGDVFPEGITHVEYTAEDGCRNRSVCQFKIKVSCTDSIDCGAPQIICPPDYTACPGSPIHPIHTGMPIIIADTANCGDYEVEFWDEYNTQGNCSGAEFFWRVWDVYYFDNPDSVAKCQQKISLEDMEAPYFENCPADILIQSDSCCEKQVYWQPPIAKDSCGLQSVRSNYDPGDYFAPGSTTVTYTAEDLCGNVSTCSFEIVVDCDQFTGYCSSRALSSAESWIESIQINEWDKTTGNNCGYFKQGNSGMIFNKTQAYFVDLIPGSHRQTARGVWRAWIDLNQDEDFEDALEELVRPVQISNGTYSDNFYIPSNALEGTTVLRISYQQMDEYRTSDVQQCCGNYAMGEVEDYQVQIRSTTDVVENIQYESNLEIYPNPSSGQFEYQLTLKKISDINIIIYNSLGQIVYKKTLNDKRDLKDILDISNQKAGSYFLKIETGQESFYKKLVLIR